MSEVAERFQKTGIPVEEVAFLDAHDWGVSNISQN